MLYGGETSYGAVLTFILASDILEVELLDSELKNIQELVEKMVEEGPLEDKQGGPGKQAKQ